MDASKFLREDLPRIISSNLKILDEIKDCRLSEDAWQRSPPLQAGLSGYRGRWGRFGWMLSREKIQSICQHRADFTRIKIFVVLEDARRRALKTLPFFAIFEDCFILST